MICNVINVSCSTNKLSHVLNDVVGLLSSNVNIVLEHALQRLARRGKGVGAYSVHFRLQQASAIDVSCFEKLQDPCAVYLVAGAVGSSSHAGKDTTASHAGH